MKSEMACDNRCAGSYLSSYRPSSYQSVKERLSYGQQKSNPKTIAVPKVTPRQRRQKCWCKLYA